jgi:prepilin-type N-terminal cleavage/methylation domain-containing protein
MKRKLAGSRADARREKRGTSGKTAFTLIELLVVIAIIAILAALLLPVLSRAKAQGQSAAYKNHLHQMGLALKMYSADYQVYPYFFYVKTATETTGWMQALEKYYPINWTNKAYHCPAYRGPNSLAYNNNTSNPSTGYAGSYAYNALGTASGGLANGLFADTLLHGLGRYYDPVWSSEYDPACKESEVSMPSECFAIGDSRLITYPPADSPGVTQMTIGFPNWLPFPTSRHGKAYNQLCCDGHVEAINPRVLFDPGQTAFRWNVDHQAHPETWP